MNNLLKAIMDSKNTDYDILILSRFFHLIYTLRGELAMNITSFSDSSGFLILLFYKKNLLIKFRSVDIFESVINKNLKSIYVLTCSVYTPRVNHFNQGDSFKLNKVNSMQLLPKNMISLPNLNIDSHSDKTINEYFGMFLYTTNFYYLELNLK